MHFLLNYYFTTLSDVIAIMNTRGEYNMKAFCDVTKD